MTTTDTAPGIGHNRPPPHLAAFQEIDDLYGEARNWADGEPIDSPEMHDAVTKLYDALSEAGKRADELRKEEKRPLDEQIKEIQDRFNPYIQPKKGKVDLGKSALGDLLSAYRAAEQRKKAEAARLAREEADRKAAEAQAALRASRGNLEEREKAEEMLAEAKAADKGARRQDKAATTGTGLRTVWTAELVDAEAGLDWAYGRDPARFTELVQAMANEAVRSGVRQVPGFRVEEKKVAR